MRASRSRSSAGSTGSPTASYYLWRSKFGGMSVSDAKRLKELEIENTRLKKLLADVPPGERGDPWSCAGLMRV